MTSSRERRPNRLPSREATLERHLRIIELNRQGLSDSEIARLVGLDRRSVSYALDRPLRAVLAHGSAA